MNQTFPLFDAFLKCPTKCYLRSTGQAGTGNAYAEWVRAQNDAYQSETAKGLIERVADTEGAVASPAAEDLKTSSTLRTVSRSCCTIRLPVLVIGLEKIILL